jgi:rhamnogalacturonyl hydrolase YesR
VGAAEVNGFRRNGRERWGRGIEWVSLSRTFFEMPKKKKGREKEEKRKRGGRKMGGCC